MEFAELAAFMAVANQRSFRRAAEQLGMSPSVLSRTIRALEQRLGARLLNRTTRSVAPTQAGEALFDRLRPAIREMNDAVGAVGAHRAEPRGLVRVNLPHVAARVAVAPMAAAFLRTHPRVRLELVLDDAVTDVVARGFDAGIRSGALVQRDMVAVRLTPDLRMAVVGSPGYFAGRPLPRVPDDIRHHVCITYRWHGTGALFRWSFDGPDGRVEVAVNSALTANDSDFLLAAALQDTGLAFLPENLVAAHVARGELVRVLAEWCRPFPGFHLYYPDQPQMTAAFRAFVDFIRMPEASPVLS